MIEKNITKKNVRIVILAMSLVMMASMTASAILADLAKEFPQADTSLIQMTLTLPALMAMISALIAGPISRIIAKKTIALFFLFAMFTGGMIFVFLGVNIYVLLFGSALIGMGQGGIMTITAALAADYFEGEECGAVLGVQAAFATGGGMLIMFVSGLLAGLTWKYSYLVFLILVPIIILTVKLLPKANVHTRVEEFEQGIRKKSLNVKVFFYCFVTFTFFCCFYIFMTNVSLLISSNGLGDATTSGMANTVMSAMGCFSGIMYGKRLKIFKKYILLPGILAPLIGFLSVYFITNLISVFIAGACCGYAIATIMPTSLFKASSIVSSDMSATALALVNSSANVGGFFSPVIIAGMLNRLGWEGETEKFLIGAIILAFLAVVALIESVFIKKIELSVVES